MHTVKQNSSRHQDMHNPVQRRFSARGRYRITHREVTGRHAQARNISIPACSHRILQGAREQHPVTAGDLRLTRGDMFPRPGQEAVLQAPEHGSIAPPGIIHRAVLHHPGVIPRAIQHLLILPPRIHLHLAEAAQAVADTAVAVAEAVAVPAEVAVAVAAEARENNTTKHSICYKYYEYEKTDSHFHHDASCTDCL